MATAGGRDENWARCAWFSRGLTCDRRGAGAGARRCRGLAVCGGSGGPPRSGGGARGVRRGRRRVVVQGTSGAWPAGAARRCRVRTPRRWCRRSARGCDARHGTSRTCDPGPASAHSHVGGCERAAAPSVAARAQPRRALAPRARALAAERGRDCAAVRANRRFYWFFSLALGGVGSPRGHPRKGQRAAAAGVAVLRWPHPACAGGRPAVAARVLATPARFRARREGPKSAP